MPYKKFCIFVIFFITNTVITGCSPLTLKSERNESTVNSDNVLNLLDPDVNTEDKAISRAKAELDQRNMESALFYYVKSLQYNPKNIEALEKIAEIQIFNKHPDLALNAYKDILKIDSGHPGANEFLGLYFLENGQNAKANEHLSNVLKINNSSWKAHNGLGIIADLNHNTEEAIAHYEAALAIEPSNPMLINNLGYSYYLAGNENKAVALFNHSLNFDNKYKRAINNLALIHIKYGNITHAVALFNRIMPAHDSYNNIGYIAIINGQYDIAEEYLQRAIDESPIYFPKAQENLNTLLTLKRTGAPYQATMQAAPQNAPALEIQPDISSETQENQAPALEPQKAEQTYKPVAKNSKAPITKNESSPKSGKAQQLAAKSDKKKKQPETRPAAKSVSSKAKPGYKKIEFKPAVKAPEQQEGSGKQTSQEAISKTVSKEVVPVTKPAEASPVTQPEQTKAIDQAKSLEAPKTSTIFPAPTTAPALPANAGPSQPGQAENSPAKDAAATPKIQEVKTKGHTAEAEKPASSSNGLDSSKPIAPAPALTSTPSVPANAGANQPTQTGNTAINAPVVPKTQETRSESHPAPEKPADGSNVLNSPKQIAPAPAITSTPAVPAAVTASQPAQTVNTGPTKDAAALPKTENAKPSTDEKSANPGEQTKTLEAPKNNTAASASEKPAATKLAAPQSPQPRQPAQQTGLDTPKAATPQPPAANP